MSSGSTSLIDGIACTTTSLGPVHWASDGLLQVRYESVEFLDQIVLGCELTVADDIAVDDAEDDVDLIEPRTVFGKVHQSNALSQA